MNNTQNYTFRRALTMVLMAAVVYLGGRLFPLALCVIPAILLIQAFGDRKETAIISTIAMLVVLYAGFGLASVITFAVLLLPVTIWLYISIKKPRKGTEIYRVAVVITIASLIFWLFWASGFQQPDFREIVDQTLEGQRQMMLDSGISEADVEGVMAVLKLGAGNLLTFLPAMVLIYALILPYMTLVIAGRSLLKHGIVIFQPPSFFLFKLPRNIMMGVLLVGLLYLFGEPLFGEHSLVVQLNGMMFFRFLFMVQGLAVIVFWCKTRGMGRLLSGALLFAFMFLPLISYLSVLLGLADTVFNFRKI